VKIDGTVLPVVVKKGRVGSL